MTGDFGKSIWKKGVCIQALTHSHLHFVILYGSLPVSFVRHLFGMDLLFQFVMRWNHFSFFLEATSEIRSLCNWFVTHEVQKERYFFVVERNTMGPWNIFVLVYMYLGGQLRETGCGVWIGQIGLFSLWLTDMVGLEVRNVIVGAVSISVSRMKRSLYPSYGIQLLRMVEYSVFWIDSTLTLNCFLDVQLADFFLHKEFRTRNLGIWLE